MLRILMVLLFTFVVNTNDILSQQAIKVTDKEVVDLKFEVDAIEFLLILDLEKNQKEILKKLVIEKISFEILEIPKYTEEYLKKLRSIRNALLEDNDELADDLRLKLDDIVEKNMIEVDYVYEVNESSKVNSKEFLKLLRVDQLSSLISFNSDEFKSPLRMLMDAVREFPDLAKDEKQESYDEILEAVIISLAGVDVEIEKKIRKEIELFLDDVLKLAPLKEDAKVKEKQAQNKPFVERAKKIVGGIGVMEILQNNVEYLLAKQLSNPQFANALSKISKK
ncbi:MAG: hypothetical protein NTV50_14300 [Planctomycetota bacterium]|nr:hypothetical protein [Planctomycetota bacterium]